MRRLLCGLLFLLPVCALADERILDYQSDIRIAPSGQVEVTETITVRAEGQRIQRGIYRDFPTTYRDRYGNTVEVQYEPLSVLRNDAPEASFSERNRNGIRTYFGSANRLLEHGVHRYVYRYRVDRMLGFFENHDEFYWNVTGLDWAFPIDRAGATVTLDFPADTDILETDAFTGLMGEQGTNFTSRIDGNRVTFETTAGLAAHQGLTIVVAWPKGAVVEPDQLQRVIWLLADNANLVVILLGLAGMLAYLVPVWRAFGRDPEEGLIVTRYEPPAGFSPASLRFIQKMYYDNKVMTAGVVNLAVKGYLRIQDSDGQYTLQRTDPGEYPPLLATGEQELHDALFAENDRVILDDEYHSRIGAARGAHRRSLRHDYRGRYFRSNGMLSLPALGIAIVSALIALNVGSGPTPLVIGVIVLMAIVFLFFATIMKRPTVGGRQVLDEMLGFRDYLDIAEKDELNLRNPPEKTPQLFEQYLPFALAMGVEQRWAEKFAAVFAALRGPNDSAWQPSWYSGSWNNFDMSGTTSGISDSLGSAISSSVTPPGSSSGGGGGGFSGGGGGGGGGGGW